MSLKAAIYGFSITRAIDLPMARIEPIALDRDGSCKRARDESAYRLTAIIYADTLERHFLFMLEAVLSYVERLDVMITDPIDAKDTTPYPDVAFRRARNSGGGAMLLEDTWSPDSRGNFVRRAVERLQDKAFCDATTFSSLFFKCVESFRQRKPFVEVKWFLNYSALEAFSRKKTGQTSGPSEIPIANVLQAYSFHVFQTSSVDLRRSISTYAHLRNALFHHGEREVVINVNGQSVKLEMLDYVYNLEVLVALTVLKALDFDDEHINWDSWIDCQPFK